MNKSIFCVACLVLASVVTQTAIGADALGEQKESTFLAKLKVDQPVSLSEKDGRYEIGMYPKEFRPQLYTVIEVGKDYVVLRDFAKIADTVIPIYSIKAIRIIKVPNK